MPHNRVAGFASLVIAVVQLASRVSAEEPMMLEQLGWQYQAYMQRTGRIMPRAHGP